MVLYRESVDVNNLGVEGIKIARMLNASEIDIKEERFRLFGNFNFNCHLSGNRYKVQVNGYIECTIKVFCDRCNEEFIKELNSRFSTTYLPIEYCPVDREEVRLTKKDLDISYFVGDKIEISEIVREQIYLMLPMKNLCRVDCKGLCSRCGVNLNYDECKCEKETDDRWLELKKLLHNKR